MYVKPKVVYSNVWEDPELNRRALQVTPDDDVLSITSGGCNSLNLLLESPRRVVSIDCNPGQSALLDLKMAAIKELSHEDLWRFLGVRFYGKPEDIEPEERLVLYGRLSSHLADDSKRFWNAHRDLIKMGVLHCGAVEKFFAIYRKVIRTLYALDNAERIFFCKTLDEQREIYRKLFKSRMRVLNHMILNKFVLGVVKGKHSFKYVNNLNFGKNFNEKLRYAFNNILLYENYFLALILLGGFTDPTQVPPYLKKENFELMKNNIGRLENRLGTLQSVLEKDGRASISKFNLSNIFEWFDEGQFNEVLSQAVELAKPGARFCYRYTLARPQRLLGQNQIALISEPELAGDLFKVDRAFMYESFHVYRMNAA